MASFIYVIISLAACSWYCIDSQKVTLLHMLSSSGQQCSTFSIGSSVTVSINIDLSTASPSLWVLNWKFNDTTIATIEVSPNNLIISTVQASKYSSRTTISPRSSSISNLNEPFNSTLILSQLESEDKGFKFVGVSDGTSPITYVESHVLDIATCSFSADGVTTNCSSDSCLYNSIAELSCVDGFTSSVSTPISTRCGACTSFDSMPTLICSPNICVPCIVIPLVWFVLSIITGVLYYKFHAAKDFPTWYTWPDNRVLVVVSIIIFPIGLGIMIWWKCCAGTKQNNGD